mgnify:CR=1 FL=1
MKSKVFLASLGFFYMSMAGGGVPNLPLMLAIS